MEIYCLTYQECWLHNVKGTAKCSEIGISEDCALTSILTFFYSVISKNVLLICPLTTGVHFTKETIRLTLKTKMLQAFPNKHCTYSHSILEMFTYGFRTSFSLLLIQDQVRSNTLLKAQSFSTKESSIWDIGQLEFGLLL